MRDDQPRLHNRALGRWGEDRVADWYRRRGFVVVARNWRHGRSGEIDLVVAHDDLVVVCEVKTRRSARFGRPAEAIDQSKRDRLRRLAAAWLAESGRRSSRVRFDVAEVRGPRIDVIENAF